MSAPVLKIGEIFESIQGEGSTVGRASIFIRTTGCTLNCKWCDSVSVWKRKGITYTPEALWTYIKTTYRDAIDNGSQIVLTGGSPLLQQDALAAFLQLLPGSIRIELETEGVLKPNTVMEHRINQFNVSPKLSNSGMKKEKRYVPDVLKYHSLDDNSIFKFVVQTTTDVIEVLDYRCDFKIPANRIWLMPLASTAKDHAILAPAVAAMARSFQFNFSPRLHIQLWDQTTGV